MVLRMQGAREVERTTVPEVYQIVEALTQRAGLPMPRVYLIESAQPNAFATGRNPPHAAVAVTAGLLEQMSWEEVTGVLAHELGHVRNRDTLIMTIAATIAGAIGLLANFTLLMGGRRDNALGAIGSIVMLLLAPFAAMLVQMAISRSREFQADKAGAEISGKPLRLASALEKIHGFAQATPNPRAEANPAAAHLFIINPLSGASLRKLFSTHPSTDERVARLRAIARSMGDTGDPAAARRGSVPSTGRTSGLGS